MIDLQESGSVKSPGEIEEMEKEVFHWKELRDTLLEQGKENCQIFVGFLIELPFPFRTKKKRLDQLTKMKNFFVC